MATEPSLTPSAWTPPKPVIFVFDKKKPKPDQYAAYTVMQLHDAYRAGAAALAAPVAQPQAEVMRALPRHKFWGAGEPDCPQDLKAPNGELHTARCKVCGDGWRKSTNVCLAALAATPSEPRFPMTYCSQCGKELGPGNEGVSHCSDHQPAPVDEFTAGVNAAAAMLDKMADDYSTEHGMQDPDTGAMEFKRGAKEDHYNTLRELADDIRSIVHGNAPAPALAAPVAQPQAEVMREALEALERASDWLPSGGTLEAVQGAATSLRAALTASALPAEPTERDEAKKARPPSNEEPWVVADDRGVRVTFRTEDAAWRYRNENTDRLTNPTVTHEPAALASPPQKEAP